jgi:hypothetical protein
MRLHEGRYECALCGAVLPVPLNATPRSMIKAASDKSRTRALILDGEVIHECNADPNRDEGVHPAGHAIRIPLSEAQDHVETLHRSLTGSMLAASHHARTTRPH